MVVLRGRVMQRPLVYPSSRSSIGLCIVYLGIFRFLMTSGRTAVAAAFRVSTPPPRAPSAVGRRLVCSSRWTRQQRSLFGSYEIHRSSMHRGLPILQLPARSLSSRRSSSATTTTCLMMDAIDEDEAIDSTKRIDSTWSIPGLKKEVARLVMRSHKKIGKAHTRLSTAKQELEKLTADPNASLEQLEQCPNTDAIEFELQELQERLGRLNQLEEALQAVKAKESVLPESIAHLALDLGVDDKPPQRPPRGPRKKKGPRVMESTRLPYRRFYTEDNTEIRVGKQAEDNDMLSLDPEHRDGSDWWMHASGCAGSHVVIRCSDQNLNPEVVMDAAALAARQSKCSGSVIKVSLTRCRQVTKPPGAKAGLVRLTGDIRTVSVNMKEAQARLDRLDKTVLLN